MEESKPQRKQDEVSDGNLSVEEKKVEAEKFKLRGNQSIKACDFNEAVNYYGKAIDLDPTNQVYYSNRAAAYIKLTKYREALVDADKCTELNDAWARGYGRKGAALFGLKRYSDAIDAYKTALRFEPSSSHYKSEIDACQDIQKGKSTSPSSTKHFMTSLVSHVMYFVQFIGHILLILSAVMSLLPVRGARAAYQRTLVLTTVLQTIHVTQQYGRPKWEKRYWMEVLKNDETHFILAGLLCMMSRPFFLGVAGHTMRSALFLTTGMQDLIRQGPRILSIFNQPIFMDALRQFTNLRYQIYKLVGTMEIIIGFMLIVEMLTPGRNIMMLFAWWQYLRVRYVLSSYTKSAFLQITRKLDGWLIHSSWCPGIVGTVYTKIKSFCAHSASPESRNSYRCNVM